MATNLGKHKRGDTFTRVFTLTSPWTNSSFTEIWFTLRSTVPTSTVTDDTDAVGQVTKTGGGITFDVGGTVGTVKIAATATNSWPVSNLYWDLQGHVPGSPDEIYTIDDGRLQITADVTRTTTP